MAGNEPTSRVGDILLYKLKSQIYYIYELVIEYVVHCQRLLDFLSSSS
jgi:hypothetical protein